MDSHGFWVGEAIEAQLDGAAGASSAALWREFEEKPNKTRDVPSEPLPTASLAAGLNSQTLAKGAQERAGSLLPEKAPRALDARRNPTTRTWSSPTPMRAGDDADVPTFGATSEQIYQINHKPKPRQPVRALGPDTSETAGVASRELGALTAEAKFEAGAKPKEMPHQRLQSEAKSALMELPPDAPGARASSAMAIVSNAPASAFDGAAGMNSAELKHASSELIERRHTISASVAPFGTQPETREVCHKDPLIASTIARAAVVPRLPLRATATSIALADYTAPAAPADYALNYNPASAHVTNEPRAGHPAPPAAPPTAPPAAPPTAPPAAPPATHAAPKPPQVRPPPAGEEPFAGQRSGHIQRPQSAWEARHVWSETIKVPRGGFGDRAAVAAAVAGGAGVSSDELAMRTAEMKLEKRSASPPPAALPRPRHLLSAAIDGSKASAERATSIASNYAFDGAAGLSSSKICENGAGVVNKFDARGSPQATGVGGYRGAPSPKKIDGAGRSSCELGEATRNEVSIEAHTLSALAAHSAQSRVHSMVGGADAMKAFAGAPDVSQLPAFSGAAGVSSEQVGREASKREMLPDAPPGSPAVRSRASPAWRRNSAGGAFNSSAGVASIFGGEGLSPPRRALSPSLLAKTREATREATKALGYGLSSQAAAISRLVSKASHGVERRSASEPRRRPSGGSYTSAAADLIFGNKHDAAGGGRDFTPAEIRGASPSFGRKTAGRTSGELAMPREERRLTRLGNSADNLMGVGGLGHYMTAGKCDAPAHRPPLVQAAAGSSPRPTWMPAGWQPPKIADSPSMLRMPPAEPPRAPSPARLPSPSRAMLTSSSAIGAFALCGTPASPVRGIRA